MHKAIKDVLKGVHAYAFSKVLLCPLIQICMQNGNEFYIYTVVIEFDYTIL